MNKADLQSQLQFISTKQVGLELYFLYRQKTNDPFQILRANLEDSTTQSRLEKVFVNKIKNQFLNQDEEGKALEGSPDWFLKHIKDVDELKNTYYYFPNEEDENEEYHIPDEFKEMVNLKDLVYEKIDVFEFEKHLIEDIFAFLIRIQIDNEQVILYKHKYSIDVLSRATVFKILKYELEHKTKFSLEKDPLLKISDKIDFMFIDNQFIIVNLQLFESKYGHSERYLKKGIESLNIIKDKNILSDTKIFDELVTNVGFSKKIMKVKANNEVLNKSITELTTFLKEFKTKDEKYTLAKRIKFIPEQMKFEVKTKIAADDFIRLLNDQYLISKLTNRPYISEVQSEFEAKEEKGKPKVKSDQLKLQASKN